MSVAAEIGEDLRRAAEGLLGVVSKTRCQHDDDPVGAPHDRKLRGESRGVGEPRQVAEEAELAGSERLRQPLEEQTSKKARKWFDRQEEPGTSGDPA